MAETGWTKPKVDGVYWWRADEADKTPDAVQVDGEVFYDFGQHKPISISIGQFLGPISPSDFQQLTRLREAARNADDALQLIQGFDFALDNSAHGQEIRRRAIAAIDRLREALAQRNTGGK